MKILHLNEFYDLLGGAEQYMHSVAGELENIGHTNVFCYGTRINNEDMESKFKVYYIPGITSYHCLNIKEKLVELKGILEKEDPDIIYIHMVLNSATIDMVTRLKPTIKFVHDVTLTCPSRRRILNTSDAICRYPVGYLCQARAYFEHCMPRNPFTGIPKIKYCKQIFDIHNSRSTFIVPSDFMKGILLLNGARANKIKVLPLFTSLPVINNGVVNKKAQILWAGRVVPEKGINYLFHAVKQIKKDYELVIIGEGEAKDDLIKLAESLGIAHKVKFTGYVENKRIGEFYSRADIVAVPSICPDNFPIIGIEAMAHCKPVIAFNVGGISEWLINGETGFLVERKDVSTLTEKIELLLNNSDLAKKMGLKGREFVEKNFTKEIHINGLLNVFSYVVNNWKG